MRTHFLVLFLPPTLYFVNNVALFVCLFVCLLLFKDPVDNGYYLSTVDVVLIHFRLIVVLVFLGVLQPKNKNKQTNTKNKNKQTKQKEIHNKNKLTNKQNKTRNISNDTLQKDKCCFRKCVYILNGTTKHPTLFITFGDLVALSLATPNTSHLLT